MMFTIPFIGGPLDGDQITMAYLPVDRQPYDYAGHSYEFDYVEWCWQYKQRWRHVCIGSEMIVYRTYSEFIRAAGRLQFSGKITACESLALQAKVKQEMGEDIWKFKDAKYGQQNY